MNCWADPSYGSAAPEELPSTSGYARIVLLHLRNRRLRSSSPPRTDLHRRRRVRTRERSIALVSDSELVGRRRQIRRSKRRQCRWRAFRSASPA